MIRVPSRPKAWVLYGFLVEGECVLAFVDQEALASLDIDVVAEPYHVFASYCSDQTRPVYTRHTIGLDFFDSGVLVGSGATWAEAWADLAGQVQWDGPTPTGEIGPSLPGVEGDAIALPPAQLEA